MVVRLNPTNMQAWEQLITVYQSLRDPSLHYYYASELWRCLSIQTPPMVRELLLTLRTTKKESELAEKRADSIRSSEDINPPELEGIPLRRFRDWMVTTGGIEGVIRQYDIYWRNVWSPEHEEHLKEKGGALGSYQDFLQALAFARSFFPAPPDDVWAQDYKRRFPKPQRDWFDSQRIHTAVGGIRVRSKSEVIIANLLTLYQIPFVYEQSLEAEDGTHRLPDFTLTWEGQTYYWEHLGMLENIAYLERCDSRLQWYREQGYQDVLMVTTEVGGLDCDILVATLEERLDCQFNR
jgi:hypothetical protein